MMLQIGETVWTLLPLVVKKKRMHFLPTLDKTTKSISDRSLTRHLLWADSRSNWNQTQSSRNFIFSHILSSHTVLLFFQSPAFRMWSASVLPGVYEKYRLCSPTQELLNQNLHLNKILWSLMCVLNLRYMTAGHRSLRNNQLANQESSQGIFWSRYCMSSIVLAAPHVNKYCLITLAIIRDSLLRIFCRFGLDVRPWVVPPGRVPLTTYFLWYR